MPMKYRNVSAILLVVAAIAYGLGRRQGMQQRPPPVAAGTVSAAPEADVAAIAAARDHHPPRAIAPNLIPDPSLPFAQNVTAAQRGYEAAQRDLDAALKQI